MYLNASLVLPQRLSLPSLTGNAIDGKLLSKLQNKVNLLTVSSMVLVLTFSSAHKK